MSAFPDWQKYVVKQKQPATGCIPTGYQMILMAAGTKGVDFDKFQDEFDFDKDLKPGESPRNNFDSVAEAIRVKHPNIHFKHICFPKNEGSKKLELVENLILQRKPVLISLALAPFAGRGWHIMPVVDSSSDSLTLFWGIDDHGTADIKMLNKADFVHIHERFQGGDDIAFLEQ